MEKGEVIIMFDNQNRSIGSATAMIIGAAFGALAVLMLDKENRGKLRRTYNQIREGGQKLKEKATDKTEELGKELSDESKKRLKA
ncbi:MAG: hypothetical protein ACD_50C00309G0013 [uncultured bacterium]|nr:MAG: hypothetical protein ACD_50C00309G0013 [uncultured bacterium]